jgi:hypothetical protein
VDQESAERRLRIALRALWCPRHSAARSADTRASEQDFTRARGGGMAQSSATIACNVPE